MSDVRNPTRGIRSERGFTLTELAVSALLLTLIMGGLYSFVFQSQAYLEVQEGQMAMRQEARLAMDRMVTEIRMAGFEMGNLAASEALTTSSGTTLQFAGDVDDSDDAVPCGAAFEDAPDGGAERITYELSGGDLLRSVDCWDGGAWTPETADQVVAGNLLGNQTIFRYFDADGEEIIGSGAGGSLSAAELAEVRLVAISFDMYTGSDEGLVGDDEISLALALTGQAKLRNLEP